MPAVEPDAPISRALLIGCRNPFKNPFHFRRSTADRGRLPSPSSSCRRMRKQMRPHHWSEEDRRWVSGFSIDDSSVLSSPSSSSFRPPA
ncbi:hypothetical protein LINGRAHAP2_LOCUS29650 [Linum grandiflorum]